jgi:glycosyltransferase involved in cell wall biosynthesis
VLSRPPGGHEPLVSIGIPTHERATKLARALDSALAQTYSSLEVVISDNASRDDTEALCRAAAARDSRIRYLRHEHDRGPTTNFNTLFAACSGEYVMMLADDDWLDPGYVAACLAELRANDGTALVAGRARSLRDGSFVLVGVLHDHRQSDAAARVRDYLAKVQDNGVFYGLMPRAVLARAGPLPNVLGNDWLHVARVACQGEVRTLPEVHIHRELGGTSADIPSILAVFGRSSRQARAPQLVIALNLLRDIAWGHPAYEPLGRSRRLVLGLAGAAISVRWRDLAWHLLTPSVAVLARRPRGRRIWAAYERFTRALGAGRRP